MAVDKVKAKRATCDGCGSESLHEDNGEPIYGFHGTVTWHHSMGGHGAEWYACRQECIKKAVTQALDKAVNGPF